MRQRELIPEARLPLFAGLTYEPAKDQKRLVGQLQKVYELMLDGQWRTLGEIREAIGGGSEAGVSARLRDLRKPHFGGYKVERRRVGDSGLWQYRMVK